MAEEKDAEVETTVEYIYMGLSHWWKEVNDDQSLVSFF
jgi:hypothetical protein